MKSVGWFRDSKPPISVQRQLQSVEDVVDCLWANPPYSFKSNNFNSFNELTILFPHADQVGKLTVFNIAGNKVRLIAAIHYNGHKVYIRNILTHNEYDKNKWKE